MTRARRLLPLVLVLVGGLAIALAAPAGAQAEEAGEPDEVVAHVARLLAQVGDWNAEDDAAWAELEAMGWEAVAPHLEHAAADSPKALHGALEYAGRHGWGDALYRIALQAMRSGDDELALSGIALLEEAVWGSWWGEGEEDGREPVAFDPSWWPELLRELHRTDVVIIDTFYSGPGFPSWNLERFLVTQVHGQEDHLIQATVHPDWRVRMMAVPFLAATTTGRTPPVEAALRRAFADEHAKVRQMAVRSARSGEWRALADAVAARLLDAEEAVAVRVEAARVLPDLADAAAAEDALIAALAAVVPEVRAEAADAADALPRTPRLVRALLERLDDESVAVREGAADGLGNVWYGPLVPEAVAIDVEALRRRLDDPSSAVRLRAATILAERDAVPVARADALAARLTGEETDDVRAAALALGSLRDGARPVLPTMRGALADLEARGAEAAATHALVRAIEAVEMAVLSDDAVEALLGHADGEQRLRAVRELVRREDTPRLVAALEHEDPAIAMKAAWHLADEAPHTEAVVDAVLRIFPDISHSLPHHVFHRMGERLEPYADRVMAHYLADPSDRWFRLLAVVRVLRPRLEANVWATFEAVPLTAEAKRVGALGDTLMPRVLEALGSREERRIGAAHAIVATRDHVLADHLEAIEAAIAGLPEDDLARSIVETTLAERPCVRDPAPNHPWIELR